MLLLMLYRRTPQQRIDRRVAPQRQKQHQAVVVRLPLPLSLFASRLVDEAVHALLLQEAWEGKR